MERKSIDASEFKFQLEGEGPGTFSGYASTFGNFDRVGERPAKGAFTPHLDDFLKNGFVSASHRWDLYIATPKAAYEDDHGLYVEAEFHSTAAAQEVRTIVKERLARGKSVSLSIGYEVLAAKDVEGGRELTDIVLREFSVVTVPANPLATILMASKSGEVSTLGFNEHAEAAVSVVAAFAERARDRAEFRLKEGRMLSGANVTKIQGLLPQLMDVHKALSDLLEAAAPKTEKSMAETHALRAQTAALQQRLRALGVWTHGNGTDL
jgi:HK97 family phage prohead protease